MGCGGAYSISADLQLVFELRVYLMERFGSEYSFQGTSNLRMSANIVGRGISGES